MLLLSNFEIGRLNWRRGKNKNELVVEVEAEDPYTELASFDGPRHQVLHTTRIGVMEHTPDLFNTEIL